MPPNSHGGTTDAKVGKAQEEKTCKIVQPHWVTESIKAGTLCPVSEFVLPLNSGAADNGGAAVSAPKAPARGGGAVAKVPSPAAAAADSGSGSSGSGTGVKNPQSQSGRKRVRESPTAGVPNPKAARKTPSSASASVSTSTPASTSSTPDDAAPTATPPTTTPRTAAPAEVRLLPPPSPASGNPDAPVWAQGPRAQGLMTGLVFYISESAKSFEDGYLSQMWTETVVERALLANDSVCCFETLHCLRPFFYIWWLIILRFTALSLILYMWLSVNAPVLLRMCT